ncbi:TPM domain-containing protein [Edaphobacter sp.]|uniref:TPM domain-containing protein n=1 Tax=Edaphobacter sp. TaxID=1934404 RepID=UPI002DBA67F5|nr:TPM domain-containing protein [Edaphobacter sp.]HEU5340958.1 TPM domain-containing protein [Edaphobacter sp.]
MKIGRFFLSPHRPLCLGTKRLLVLLTVAVMLWPQTTAGQQPIVPKLTLSQLESLVSHGVPDSTMHMEILRRGLAFAPGPGSLESLRSKGAGLQTLEAIETFFPNSTPKGSKSPGSAGEVFPRNFPLPTGYVNDFGQVLSAEAVARLDRVCGQLDHSQTNAQVAVVTIYTLDGADIAAFAKGLFNKWKIGPKGSDRRVLVLLAVNDRKYRIAVGHGLESAVTDTKAAEIGREVAPLLYVNNFDGSVTLIVNQIARVIADEAKVKLDDAPGQLPQR